MGNLAGKSGSQQEAGGEQFGQFFRGLPPPVMAAIYYLPGRRTDLFFDNTIYNTRLLDSLKQELVARRDKALAGDDRLLEQAFYIEAYGTKDGSGEITYSPVCLLTPKE